MYCCIIILVSVCRFSTIPICKDYVKFLFVKFTTSKQAQGPKILKGPVKLIKQVKIAHSFLHSVSDQFHVIF